MEYHGKLYGKIGKKYFDTGTTSDYFDELSGLIDMFKEQAKAIRSEFNKQANAVDKCKELQAEIDRLKSRPRKLAVIGHCNVGTLSAIEEFRKTEGSKGIEFIHVQDENGKLIPETGIDDLMGFPRDAETFKLEASILDPEPIIDEPKKAYNDKYAKNTHVKVNGDEDAN